MMQQEKIPVILPKQLLIPLLFIFLFFFVLYAQLKQDYMMLALGISVPFILMLTSKMDVLVIASIALYFSEFTIRYLPMNLMLYQLCMALFVGLSVARRVVSKKAPDMSPCALWGFLFAAWLLVIIYFRGTAMTILGSSQIGGAAYMHAFIAIAFYFFSGYATLSEKQWRIAIIGMFTMMLVVFVLNLIIIATRGAFWYPLIFMNPTFGLMDTFIELERDARAARWSVAGPLTTLYLFPAFMWPFKGKRNIFLYAVFLSISLAAALVSGGRFHLITLGFFVFIFSLLYFRAAMKTFAVFSSIGLIVWVILIPLAPRLPFGAQRTLSMLPGMRVNPVAAQQAQQTLLWREALWTMVLDNLPNYLLVGRGFGVDQAEHLFQLTTASQGPYNTLWRAVYHTYIGGHMHQGILDLLLFLGLLGAVLFIAWVVLELVRHIKIQNMNWNRQSLKQFHLAMTAFFATHLLQHATIHGGIQFFIPKLVLFMAILQAIRSSDLHMNTHD